jgi:glycine cleavage system H protein
MNAPDQLRYTRDHEWAEVDESANRVRMGITDYAQDALGDIVFVQVPTVGTNVQAGMSFSEVESTKSVSDVYAPISGVVVEVNESLGESPQDLNEDPYGRGWICIIEPVADADFSHFMDAAAYRSLVGDE